MADPRTIYFLPVFILLLVYYITSYPDPSAQRSVYTEKDSVSEDQINSTFPIIFYHYAYIDHRYKIPRLRIFSLNHCITKTNFLLIDIYYEGVTEATRTKVFGESLEGHCPSTYGPAKPCVYVAHTFYIELVAARGISEVLIHLGSRKVKLQMKNIEQRYEKGITMCLQPVYYYSQWQNIVLYIEAWKAQGATRFIVFYHSATRDTREVLDYYRDLGIIEYRSWPSFGSLPNTISMKHPEIDNSVFIFSYFLAMNVCILEIKTTIGAVADFDEVLVPRNGTMLEYATREMTGTNVGALSFGNNYVTMKPSIYTSDFSGLESPIFIDKGGPSKYIFNASVIEICQVHWVKSFTDPTKKTKNGDGALLHMRYGASGKTLDRSKKPFRYFPDNSRGHIQNMKNIANKIFNGSIPEFSPIFIDTLNQCVDNIRKTKNSCRSTGGMCKPDMDAVYEWVYDKTKGVLLSGEN